MNLLSNVDLKPYNTFGIAAFARYFTSVSSLGELKEILSSAELKKLDKLVLGGGSNILLTKNVDGLVIKNDLKGVSAVKEDVDHVYVKAGAGEPWHGFVMYCIDHNYSGVENLSLIPGNVGASPMQNIGAYGVEIKDVFYELEALNTQSLEIETFNAAACKFGYRESIFKREAKNKYIILNVTYRLNKKPVFNISYGAISQELEKMGVKDISIQAISKAVIQIRSSKLPDPAKLGNAGSFFKNPVISMAHFDKLKREFPEIVAYKNGDHQMKLAAGWLIERCGWKGKRVGNTGSHKDQSLVLVNYGGATGAEIFELSGKIIESVRATFEVELEREVNII